jgi:hypothetical protein
MYGTGIGFDEKAGHAAPPRRKHARAAEGIVANPMTRYWGAHTMNATAPSALPRATGLLLSRAPGWTLLR